jgi:hypothetical protein
MLFVNRQSSFDSLGQQYVVPYADSVLEKAKTAERAISQVGSEGFGRAKRIPGCSFSVLLRDNVSGVLNGVIDRHPIVQIDLQCLQKGPTRETCLVVTRMVAALSIAKAWLMLTSLPNDVIRREIWITALVTIIAWSKI